MPLILLPVFLLLFAGIILLLIRQIKPDFGSFWVASVGAALIAWGGLLALRWQTPLFFSMDLWQEIGFQVSFPLFQLDPFSWPYAFSLSGLALATILTAPVRISRGSNPGSWAGTLILGALAILAVMAANPLTLVLAWTAMDILELAHSLRNAKDNPASRQAVISFSIGIGGTLLAVWAMLVSQSQGLPLSFSLMTPDASQYLILAAGVRLAIFPIMATFRQEMPAQRGFSTLMKLAAPAVSLVLLARLPAVPVSEAFSPVLFTLTIIALVYGSVSWFVSSDEIKGRPYWIIGFSALAMASLLQGRPEVSPVWGSAMVLGGGLLSLFVVRQARLLFIPLIAFGCLTGIIFTPASAGWSGLWIEPFRFANIIFVVCYSLLLAGFVKHTFRQEEDQEEIDRWVQVIYPAGLIIVLMTFLLAGIWSIEQYGIQSFWIGSTTSVGLSVLWLIIRVWLGRARPLQSLLISIGKIIGSVAGFILGLKWFFRPLFFLFTLARQFVFWFTNLLEGDGGVLWALLVLLLIITLIQPGVMP